MSHRMPCTQPRVPWMRCPWMSPYEPPRPRSGGRGAPVWRCLSGPLWLHPVSGAAPRPPGDRGLSHCGPWGHATQCDQCGHLEITYNSCGNRHCPKCPGRAQAAWLAAREAELLDVPYVHVVFTLPHLLSPLALQNPRVLYTLLFQAVAETLLTVARDPHHLGADIGFLAVLHTWGQTLHHHPHLHCVVPGGGLSPDGTQWIACRPRFFLPVRVLSRLFRRLFLKYLVKAFDTGKLRFFSSLEPLRERRAFFRHLAPTRAIKWVV